MKKAFVLVLMLALALNFLGLAEPVSDEVLVDAFSRAAFRAEYDSSGMDALRRWAGPLLIWVEGQPTQEDLDTLDSFIAQLNDKVQGLPQVGYATTRELANVQVVYAPLAELPSLSEIYVPGNWGFFSYWYNALLEMTRAQILIATDVTTQKERNHLLMEEIVGALGLSNDLDDHPDSIIHQKWTTTQALSPMDWQLLDLLYDERMAPGMTWQQARKALGLD